LVGGACGGTITRTWNVSDACGNPAATRTQIITVDDTTIPTVTAPSTVDLECAGDLPVAATTIAAFNALPGAAASDNCTTTASLTVTHADVVTTAGNCNGVITRTYTIKDACNNTQSVNQIFTITDTTPPTFTRPADITIYKSSSSCTYNASVTFTGDVTDEADKCAIGLQATYLESVVNQNVANTTITRTWSLVDYCGNAAENQVQIITVLDNTPPVALCKPITVDVDEVFTAAMINNGSTDNCGIASYALNRYSFDCTYEAGVYQVTLTVTDYNGNISTCTANVTLNPSPLNAGTLTGHNYFSADPDGPEGAIINVTACPEGEVKNALLTLSGYVGIIDFWEFSENGGATWTKVISVSDTYNFTNILKTTLVRVHLQIGSCGAYSPNAVINVIPPDIKPTVDNDTFYICLGQGITATASSEYANNILLTTGGLFNQANPDEWRVNGLDNINIPADADNGAQTIWSETNGPKLFGGGITYDTSDNTKFAIANGNPSGFKMKPGNITWTNTWTSLETPIFNSLGLDELYLTFDQAYNLKSGAYIKIELSTDGGANYNITLDPGINSATLLPHNYTGPSDSGAGTYTNFTHTSINLADYIGQTKLRVRFWYESGGSTTSAWAIDNIAVPDSHVVEVIEWTDENGDPITQGWTATIVPKSPGLQYIGVTSLIDNCRSKDSIGTQSIKVYVDYAYAGKNIVSDDILNLECGKSIVTLNAYDNYLTANENDAKGAWDSSIPYYKLSDYPGSWVGTGKTGKWSILPEDEILNCNGDLAKYSFGDDTKPNSTFTGEPGTYKLTWTIPPLLGQTVGCSSSVNVTITTCENLNFDGVNDHIYFTKDDYNLPNQHFSMEVWIKPNDVLGIRTILSKRGASINPLGSGSGYDLRLQNGEISFNWGAGGNIVSPYNIGINRWYHIAVTFNGGTYKLYIDGIEVASKTGQALLTTDFDCLVGAMDNTASLDEDPVNYYSGYMQELRIWNKALTPEQLRQMMNQKIIESGTGGVIGEIVPIEVNGLSWVDLAGYYHMDISCGQIMPAVGTISGRLRNIFTNQLLTAPLPYTTIRDGNWNDRTALTPWTYGDSVWDYPNSTGVNGAPIDWNIVRTTHNIISGTRDITVLGLLSEINPLFPLIKPKITITGATGPDGTGTGQGLWITHYLKLDGIIDLVGESQLVQKRYGTYDGLGNFSTTQFSESIFDATSTGYIERDQQGQKNSFNYNYWSSPVTRQGAANNAPYKLPDVLRDGTNSATPININFVDGAFSADSPLLNNPIKITSRWIWTYNAVVNGDPWYNYYQWKNVGYWGNINVGDGFSMKGTGGTAPITAMQNYVFVGKPNSGDITTTQLNANQTYLIGNPYPSALDANEFIKNNLRDCSGCTGTANVFNGALYFWDHFRNTDNHLLAQYSGGYAVYTLIGGVVAIADTPLTINDNKPGSKIPERYIPVGQGFFVEATLPILSGTGTSLTPGNLYFKNSQRVFQREVVTGLANNGSVFMKTAASKKSETAETTADSRPKIRLQFDSPTGYQRRLLVGVDERTTNNFDIGFDAPLNEDNKEDMFWQLGKGKLVIQGVNNFNEDQELPLGLKIAKAGLATIKIEKVQNIDENTTLHIKDKFTGKTYNISQRPFEIELEPGEYLDRFALVFKMFKLVADDVANGVLVVEPIVEDHNYHVFMNNAIQELQIKNNGTDEIQSIFLYNNIGQIMHTWNTNLNRRIISLPVKLATGVYIVQINTKNGTNINKRIIIE